MIVHQIKSYCFALSLRNVLLSTLQILGGSLLLAFCAQINIPLYFTPVPLSCQTLGAMLIGAMMGSRKGALVVFTYLLEACFGLPFFAGGCSGILRLFGPTGGYLLALALQAYLAGWFVERQKSFHTTKTMMALLSICMIHLTIGSLWLSQFVGLQSALAMGIYPFLIGEVIKTLGLTAYLKSLHSISK